MENEHSEPADSPAKELEFILRKLGEFYEIACFGPKEELVDEFEKLEESTSKFDCVSYYSKMLEEEEAEFWKPEVEESRGHSILLMTIYASMAHCAEARRPEKSLNRQWWHISWASMYLGLLRGTISGRQMGMRAAIRTRAVKAAAGRHKETNEMKKEVFEWLDENMGQFKSMDAAAEAVRRVAPVGFRTARDWVGYWKKMTAEKKE